MRGVMPDEFKSASVLQPFDPDDDRPPVVKIADRIREAIEAGVFRQGEVLPGGTPIGQRYGVSDRTAVRALKLLAEAGIVRVVHRVGTFVRVRGGAS